MIITLTINNEKKNLEIKPNDTLLKVLRKAGYKSVKHGCETGECGACTVVLDNKAVPSCIVLAAKCDNSDIITLEGLYKKGKLHPLQQAFLDEGAVQCGYCTPGMIMSAYALLKEKINPTEDEVRDALSGNLCRCTGYVKPVNAVLKVAERI